MKTYFWLLGRAVVVAVLLLVALIVWAVIRAREPYTPTRNPISTGIIVIGTNQPPTK